MHSAAATTFTRSLNMSLFSMNVDSLITKTVSAVIVFLTFIRRPVHRTIVPLLLVGLAATLLPTQAQAQTNVREHQLAPDTWHLLSLPGNHTQTINQLFADDFNGQVAGTIWSIAVFDAQQQTYRTLAGGDRLQAGQGFWMIHLADSAVTLQTPVVNDAPVNSSSACTSAEGCVAISLPEGDGARWSLIGLPFNEPVAVSQLRIQTQNGACRTGCSLTQAAQLEMTGGELFALDVQAGRYQPISGSELVIPGVGYWFPSVQLPGAGTAQLLIPKPGDTSDPTDVFAKAAQLGRGMNLGNALEAPTEGLWGITLESYYFDRIAEIGFDSVRVPIRWSTHADNAAPYAIDPVFLERIDWVLAEAARVGLAVVLNVHHYEALMASPASERARYLSLWRQIAERYAAQPDSVFFELLNEPTEQFNDQPALWNALLADAVNVVRQSNPDRALVVGPVGWNAIDRLVDLQLPDDDQLIATVHFYSPFDFTHQGATWVTPVQPVGVSFDADETGFGGAFQDWSWDTSWVSVANGVRISYQRQYAGFNVRKLVPGEVREMSVSIGGPVQLAVTCGDNGVFTEVAQIVQTSSALQNHRVDLSSCPTDTANVVLQNLTPSSTSFIVEQGEICTTAACYSLFETAGDALSSELQVAADWGQDNNIPVYVGEFGAFSAGDLSSRASWTQAVQSAIQELGMTSAYWEFGSGFGAFDISQDRWNEALLGALLER